MRKLPILLCAALLMIGAPRAHADTITLTSPSAVALDFEGNGLQFIGGGLMARQDLASTLGLSYATTDTGCDPCSIGETWNPSFSTAEIFLGNGPGTFAGTSYSSLSYYGTLNFAATPIAFLPTDPRGSYMQTSFLFTGTLRAMEGSEQAFAVALQGAGTALRFFDPFPGGTQYGAGENTMLYHFGESSAQTPEPASLVLLGTGIAGVLARRRRQG